MTDRGRRSTTAWGTVGWCVGVLVLLAALPPVASSRLPERLATHWNGGSGRPDDSMPLWAAAPFPALVRAVLTAVAALALRRAGTDNGAIPGWALAGLGFGGVMLLGGQASIVRANLDHADWRDADSVTSWVVGTLVVAATVGAIGSLAAQRAPAQVPSAADDPALELPAGQRLVWLGRTSIPWLQAVSAVTGLLAIAVVVGALAGLADPPVALAAPPFALACVLVLASSSVQARVTERGLDVSFGPLGWPSRRWALEDIESARTENRTPAQVGGWGYRLSGLGTTVMLRGGECLVIRTAKGKDFAVSVDDAEHGAALLNSLSART
ncbi:protein-S-isoprenylcysteine O-methyltransferase Ste14 [Streptomyces achromogenes]|uniref:Protein-S-isoprenylcysteine O-methyltransferase Ste14 n=1 Tax=Streptomyces achromogenes TaxID=67255 RepID=A0ABU0QDQ6_STRAH|nr:DUF1648 domain-containing protein [Streptomyces achromogenes]MDQ0688784.1 protein-S-isoprenylcysteine O-methyltransferase Ste14 [Streptomyces achromogenes]